MAKVKIKYRVCVAIFRDMIKKAQAMERRRWRNLPDKARTVGQWRLMKKHGTPRAFARSAIAAIGEITPKEAATAIRQYLRQWRRH